MQYPIGQEYSYRKILLNMNKQYKLLLKRNMSPYVEAMAYEATEINLPTGDIRQDALGWQDQLTRIMQRMASQMTVHENRAIKEMLRIAPGVNQYNKDQWRRLVRSQYGVNPINEDPEKFMAKLGVWSRNNALFINDIPSKMSKQIADATRDALVKGTNLQDTTNAIYDIMFERTDVGDSRARLIARDQVSKLNGDLTRDRQLDLGVEGYIWRTVGDERVRDTHSDNDGKFFSWDNPPAETGHPGEDFQCRCWAEPVLPEFVEYEARLLEEAD